MNPKPAEFAADPMFRGLVSAGSGAAIGGMLASLAAVGKGPAGKLVFAFNAWVPVLFAVGLVLGWYFWRLLWRAQSENTGSSRRKLQAFGGALGLLAMASFAYPLRFLQPERRHDVFFGLGLAIVVLGSFGVLIYKTIRWVESGEPKDGESGPDDE